MRNRIKVIELINQIHEGGAETLVKDYALYLDPNIFDVTILTEFPLSVKSANVRILLNHKAKIKAPFGVSKERIIDKICRKLRKLFIPTQWQNKYREWFVRHQICKIRPDVIHVHLEMLQYLPDLYSRLQNTKILYTCHSLPYRYFNDTDRQEQLIAANFLIKHHNLQLIGLQDAMRKELDEMFHVTTSVVVNNCVDLSRFENVIESPKEIRESIGIPRDAFVIGHNGRFVPLKNQPFIVDVFNAVLKKQKNAYLLLIGDGDTGETLRKLEEYKIAERCKILSHRHDIPQLLKAMDVFIFPSKFEGLGIACVEAQAAGLRCIISDTVPHEIFFSARAVPLSLSEDVAVWAEAIIDNNVKGCFNNDIRHYDVHSVIKQLSDLYRK